MINYQEILNQNLLNVLKDILTEIKSNGLSHNNHLYITFLTNHKDVKIPKWLLKKHPELMTIVIQYEYYDLKIDNKFFQITLSFNDIRTTLKIGYNSIISFADPSANFGLKIKTENSNKKIKKTIKKQTKKDIDNIINFSNYKKN